MTGDQPAVPPAKPKEFIAMVHVGLRERSYVVDTDGATYTLPAGSTRLGGQRVAVVADPATLTATLK